jgi:phosphotransferase system HPr-like phosphotransfer protein
VITSICLTNGIVTIKWNSVTGGIYRVQYNNNLSGSGWADLSPDVTATNSTATQTNAVGGVLQRFYRVELLNAGLTANDKVYDGTTTATLSSNNVILVGVVNGDSVSLVTNGYTANFATANAGTGIPVTVSGLTLSGPSAGNYTLAQPVGLTANITGKVITILSVPPPVITSIGLTNGVATIKWSSVTGGIYRVQYDSNLNGNSWADLSPDVTATNSTATQTNAVGGAAQRFYRIKVLNSGITANNKMYDGTTIATLSSNNVTLLGLATGDVVGLSTNGYTASFATPNVGTAIPVTVTGLTLAGANAADYTLVQPAGLTANITPATLTVSAVNNSKIYGLPNPSLTASYSGFVNSEGPGVLNGAPSLITGATISSPPGSYNIQAGVGTLSAANYVFNFVDGTLSVVGAPQLSSVFMSGNQLALSWPTVTSETYQLEYKDDLAAPTWTPIPGSIPGTGTRIIVTNNLGGSPQRFFRLIINNNP